MAELAAEYLGRTDGDQELAAALVAHDLMQGDPETYKAGYTRENAMIAAAEVFPAASMAVAGVYLDERLAFAEPKPAGVLGLTEWENGLVARALGAGEPLDRDETIHLRKVARLAEMRRDEVKGRVEAVIAFLESGGGEDDVPTDEWDGRVTAGEMREALAVWDEATTALLDAVASAEGRLGDGA